MNRWLTILPVSLLTGLLSLGPAGGAHAALGDSAADLVYTPVAPCRIIDTRIAGAGGRLVAGTPRDFDVAGDLVGQGGAATCGIPFGPATSVVLNFVAVAPAGAGNLRAWAFGAPVPTASIINYAAVPGLNIANGLVVPICDPMVSTCTKDLTVRADASDTHLVADVVGFFRNVQTACQAGTVKALGECFETALRAATTVFIASDTCRTVGGRMANVLELRSLRGGNPLTLGGQEWTDSVYADNTVPLAITISNAGGFSAVSTVSSIPFRCVFRPLP